MKILKFVFKVLYLLIIAANFKMAFGQPADLLISATAGGEEPTSLIRTINISANGESLYGSYIPLQFTQPPLEEINFTLTQPQLNQIWQAIQNNNFFNLSGEYSNPEVYSRTFVRLRIRANGQIHEVITRNIAVGQFDNIISAINNATPGDADLIYDTSDPVIIEPEDPCEGSMGFAKYSNEPAFMNKKTKNQSEVNKNTSSNIAEFGGTHGGTTVAYRMSLEEAIDFGVVQLKSKGRNTIYGDEVEITVDNTGHVRNDKLTLIFYLALYGQNANEEILSTINDRISHAFGGFTTSQGEPLYVETRAILSPDLHSVPPDYHIISITDDGPFDSQEKGEVNFGTIQGTWSSNGYDIFAHYAGHLLGLNDFYDLYDREDENEWMNRSNGSVITTSELALLLLPSHPEFTVEELENFLGDPLLGLITVPFPDFENYVMAMPFGRTGRALQPDIDNITNNVGILVEVRPGTIVVNENDESQNLVITHNLDLYVAPGEVRVLEGIYGACIDADKFLPEKGNTLHVAPSLDTWNNVNAAPVLLKLAEYLDKNNLYCDYNFLAQSAIWRLTDNKFQNDQDIKNLFLEAGIDIDDNEIFDFPRLSYTGVSGNGTTSFVPKELFVSKVNPFFTLITPGESVNLTEKFGAPSEINEFTANTGWSLMKPSESNSQLSNVNDSTVSLTTDVRGVYRVKYDVDINSGDPNSFSARTYGGYIIATDVPTATFESGELFADHFNWQTSEENPWHVTTESANSGVYSATTGYLSTGDVAELEIDADVTEAGKLSFASSLNAAFSDSLVFYIDGVKANGWHGEVDWTQTEYDLTVGHHNLKWIFSQKNIFGNGHNAAFLDDVFFPKNSTVADVQSQIEQNPSGYQLFQNYPNPFNPTTNFEFQIADFGFVSLKVYDVLGKEVATLMNEEKAPGVYSVSFNASELSSGVYFYKLETGNFVSTKKMILLR